MPTVCHVFDETADWQHRVGVNQLLDRLPNDKFRSHLASIDAKTAGDLGSLPASVEIVPRVAGINLLAAPLLRGRFDRSGADLIHAWGPSAATAARSASQQPLVVELYDPALAAQSAKILRTIIRPEGFAVICSTQWIRRRLIENGVPAENCVVIRPGIDFAAIQKMRKSPLRGELGIADDEFVIVLPEPRSCDESSLDAFWAGALLNHLDGHYKVIVPGVTSEVERIGRFASNLPTSGTLIAPGRTVPFEHLVAIADALIVTDPGEAATTSIAWAFGAGAAVIAAATYAVTELVVTRVNGLLYKHHPGKSAASRIVALLRDRESQRKVKEAARGQAYEVFSLRRYVDQHALLYENLLAGRPPSHGITDPAQVSIPA